MRFCIGFQCQNEAAMLRLHLPVWIRAAGVDGLVAIDGGSSDDTVAVIESFGVRVFHRPFDNFENQGNRMIEACEAEGYDAMLRLDPDELMFPDEVAPVKAALERYKGVYLPRWNFMGDRLHYRAEWYPDPNFRAWWLGQGLRYKGVAHSIPDYRALGWRYGNYGTDCEVAYMPEIHVYHYGWINLTHRRHREAQTANILRGEAYNPAAHLADGFMEAPLYEGKQPLDPQEIGSRAPYAD